MSVIAADARLSPRATTRAHAVVRRRRYLSFVGTVVLSFGPTASATCGRSSIGATKCGSICWRKVLTCADAACAS